MTFHSESSDLQHHLPSWPRIYTTLLLSFTVLFIYANQTLLAPNFFAIGKYFGFDEEETTKYIGAYISIGFYLVGAVTTLLVGYLTDTFDRRLVFAVVILIGEGGCLATYWVNRYWQLVICRALTGVSIGGACPILFSMLADLYSTHARVYVAVFILLSMSVGITAGQLLAGFTGSANWKLPFMIVAIPALVCGFLVFATIAEPQRGDKEEEVLNQKADIQRHALPSGNHDISNVNSNDRNNTNNNSSSSSSNNSSSSNSSGVNDDKAEANNEDPLLQPTPNETNSLLNDSNNSNNNNANDGGDSYLYLFWSFVVQAITGGNRDRLKPTADNIVNNAEDGCCCPSNDTDVMISYDGHIDWAKFSTLFSTPSFLIILLQAIPGSMPWALIYTYLNSYLSKDDSLTVADATVIMTVFGCSGLAGIIVGGVLGQQLFDYDPRLQCAMMGIAVILSAIPLEFMIDSSDSPPWSNYFTAAILGFISQLNWPNVNAVLQNVCVPEVRGTAFGFFNLFNDIGIGLGPFTIYLIILMVGDNTRLAFDIVAGIWVLCGAMLLCLVFTVVDDERAVQRAVKQAITTTTDNDYNEGIAEEGMSSADRNYASSAAEGSNSSSNSSS